MNLNDNIIKKNIAGPLLALFLMMLTGRECLAVTILYPGSFDPFHLTHEAEANGVLAQNPGADLLILPIEKAYYNRVQGLDQPSFFAYDFRVQLLKSEYAANPHIRVSTSLRSIDENPIARLTQTAASLPDPDRKILIGTDVLEKWQDNPALPALLKEAQLVVSRDPHQSHLHTELENKFAKNARVHFVDLPLAGMHSVDLIRDLFSESPEAVKQAQAQLPPVLAHALGGSERTQLRDRYRQDLSVYLRHLAQVELQPLIRASEGKLSAEAYRLLKTTPENLYLLMMLLPAGDRDSASTKQVADGMLAALKSDAFRIYFGGKENQPLIIEELRKFVADPQFMKTSLAQGFQFGREYIYPRYKIWDWTGIDAPELAGEAEIRKTGQRTMLFIKEQGKWISRGDLETLKAHAPLYHWNKTDYTDQWTKDGRVAPAEVLWRDLFMDGMAGGGMYVSKSPTDSKSYGPVQMAFFADQDLQALSFDFELSKEQALKQTQFLRNPFVHMILRAHGIAAAQTQSTPNWFTILQPSALPIALPGAARPSLMCRELFARPSHP